jgi:hypothetical protein
MPVCSDIKERVDLNPSRIWVAAYDTTVADTGNSDWGVTRARFPATYHDLDDGWVINFPIVNTFAESKFIRFLLVNPVIEIGRVNLRLRGKGTEANKQEQ